MMDYEALQSLIAEEKAHFDEVDRRRKTAFHNGDPKDVLALYERLQEKSLRVLSELTNEKYRREYEQSKNKTAGIRTTDG